MALRPLAKTTWVELKLFAREPLTVVFALGLPLVLLFVLGSVFGNTPDPEVYRGVGPMDYYVPAYIGLVIASMGLIGLPVHIAGYRERGVLRRFRASAVRLPNVLEAQVVVTVVAALAGSLLLGAVAALTYDLHFPESVAGLALAFLLGSLAFAAIGVFLGCVMPTARAAQGAGVLLWFVMLLIGGPGPPLEILSDALRTAGDLTPLKHVVVLLQDPWLGFARNWTETWIVLGWLAGAAILTALLLRREG